MTTNRLAPALLAVAFIAACGGRAAAPQPPVPAQPPTPAQPPAPTPAHEVSEVHRLDAGSWPGSNAHRWGSRWFELRKIASGLEVRIHDAINFQGVGMQPKDMSPTRHHCTPWESLPPEIAMPVATTCAKEGQICDAIRAYYEGTTRPSQTFDMTRGYNRAAAPCS